MPQDAAVATDTERYADLADYHKFVKRDTPKAERRLLGVGDIWSNAVRCRTCGELVRSRHRHDFRWCKCGTVAVDGGSWYSKRSVKEEADFEEMTELFDDVEV